MKLLVKKGTTDKSIDIFIQDSSKTDGSGLTGLVYNTSGLVCYYHRPGSTPTQLTLATQTVTGSHADGGFVEISAANMPGWYRLDLSDAICAVGVDQVGMMLKGANNMAPCPIELQLTGIDVNDAIGGGMSATLIAAYGGKLYLDSTAGNTNTVKGEDGTSDKPVSSWAAITTLAASTGIKNIMCLSIPSLDRDLVDYTLEGRDGDVTLNFGAGSYNLNNSRIKKLRLVGNMNGLSGGLIEDCYIYSGISGIGTSIFTRCKLAATLAIEDGSDPHFLSCFSTDGDTAVVNFSSPSGTTNARFSDYGGDLVALNGNSSSRLTVDGRAKVTIDSSCTSIQLEISGPVKLTDNGTTTSLTDNRYGAEAGDEMNLVDDAITSSKYDESTAFPIKSNDAGATQIARTGADGDTLETLSDQIDETATPGDQMTLEDDSITSDKFDESTAFPLKSADSGDTEVARTGADGDTLETLSDEIEALNNLSSADVQAACDSALDAYDSGNGVAKESSVEAITNNTLFEFATGKYYLKPTASYNVYQVVVNLKDNDGGMEDPDNNDMALQLTLPDATSKNAVLYKEVGCTTALDATSISGLTGTHKKLERTGVGRYFCFVKVDSSDSDLPDQLMFNFAYEEDLVMNYHNKSTQVFDSDPGTITLADNTTNADIIAEALKERNVSGVSPVTGSIYKDIMDNVDDNGTAIGNLNDLSQAEAQTAAEDAIDTKFNISAGIVETNLKQINDDSVVGNLATLTLKTLNIQNSTGSALVAKSTGGGGHGFEAKGENEAAGIYAEGGDSGGDGIVGASGSGSTGDGIKGLSQATNGNGFSMHKSGSGKDIDADEIDTLLTNVAAILVDTDTTIPGLISSLQTYLHSDHITLGTEHDTILGAINDNLLEIQDIQGRIPAALQSGRMRCNVDAFGGNNTVDGTTLALWAELVQAMVYGRFKKDTPTTGQVTFYKKDNTTVLFVVSVTTTERNRVTA